MKKKFSIITYHIERSALKHLINECLSSDENIFKEIRRLLPKDLSIPGFSSVKKVPFQNSGRLTNVIINSGVHFKIDGIAKLLLQCWYLKHIEIIGIIKTKLTTLGYNVVEPDFTTDYIDIQSLKSNDVYQAEDDVVYFRPNGKQIDGVNDEEATLASALLGWIVLGIKLLEKGPGVDECENEVGNQAIKKTIMDPETDNIYMTNLDNNTISKELDNNTSQDFSDSNTKEIDPQELINSLETEFKTQSDFFTDLAKTVFHGYIPEIKDIQDKILFLKEKIKEYANLLGVGTEYELNSVPQLRSIYEIVISHENEIKKEKETIVFLLNQISAIKNKKVSSADYLDKLKAISADYHEKITLGVGRDKDWYKDMISKKHYFNTLVNAIELRNNDDPNEEVLDGLLDEIKKQFIQNKLDFYEQLATQINRGNIYIDNTLLDLSFKENDVPDQIIVKEKTEIPEESTIDPQLLPEQKIKSTKENVEVESSISQKALIENLPSKKNKPSKRTEEDIPQQRDVPANVKEDTSSKEPKERKSASDDLSEEDRTILDLLLIDEPEMAYHLALCYEQQSKTLLLPSYLLQNLFLSLYVRTITGPVALALEPNFLKYNFVFEKSDKGHFINQLIFASILRPCFFAYDSSGAGILLNDLYAGKQGEFSDIKRLIIEFMSQNSGMFNYKRISHLNGQAQLKENKAKYLNKIKTWIDHAQTDRYRNKPKHYHTQLFNNWVKKDGWITGLLDQFLKNKDGSFLRTLIENDLEDSNWQKRYQKELKVISGNQKSAKDNTEAFRWFENNISNLIILLEEGLAYFSDDPEYTFQHDEHITVEFIENILEEFKRISEAISSNENDNIFNRIAVKYIDKAFQNIEKMLTVTSIDDEQPPINWLLNIPLLKLHYYESDISWSPTEYNDSLANMILAFANEPQKDYYQVADRHIESGNIEALTKLVTAKVITEDDIDFSINIQEFSNQLTFELLKARTEIERGCALGYILNGQRDFFLSAIIEIEEKNKNSDYGINYPLRKSQINHVVGTIEQSKKEAINHSKSLMPSKISPEFKNFLNETLSNGNILVFNESIERIQAGEFVLTEEKSNIFKSFFQEYLKQESSIDLNQVLKSLKTRSKYKSVDYGKITEFQSEEAAEIILEWQAVKRTGLTGDKEGFSNIKKILDYIGFVSADFELADRYKKTLYFDFTCTTIKGRTQSPLPQYGSVAEGKYRLIIFRDRITEEDQLQLIKELIPITNRPVLVFNFFYLNHRNRLSIAKLSRKSKTTFLQLDDAMLIFLTSVKESKLPAFIKLAAPFTYAEPYQTASSNLPEEMFYGRGAQIRKLIDRIGDFSCLIYGGRQLGKTVLQREVERRFNQPHKGYYAIYIDLRESGIGKWRPIDDLPSVLVENLNIIPGLLPDKYNVNAKLTFLLNRIKEWIDKNNESRIILFLDESDKFLEDDSIMEWRHVLPLKGLMEKTDKRFKVVLAGLHDVRRTIKIPNNPLAHFGSPICVGPMLEKEEALEAQALIKLPLETLGMEFLTDDLVFMILSHCNWYPSLIQIFCSKLLNVVYEKRQINDLPIIIDRDDITAAYERSRELIREKFNLTLGLDERYDLLANIIASETIHNPAFYSQGLSVEDVTELATFCWPEGFESTNSKVEVQNLLEEMVDLGVLRIEPTGRVALRTPNLLGLIGDEKQINDNLEKERKKPTEFKRETSRIIYSVNNREVRSPFPASYYDKLINPESKVVIVRGSKMGGIQYVSEFLRSQTKEVNLIIPEYSGTFEEETEGIWKFIDKKRISGKHNLVLFEASRNYDFDCIHKMNELFEGKTALTAVFLIDSFNLYNILLRNDKSFERLENLKVKIFNIPQWHQEIASEWFRETGCITADISEIFKSISNWHKLLDEYHKTIIESPETWQEKLTTYQHSLIIKKPELLKDFGLINEELIGSIRELIEWDGSINRDEYIHDNSGAKSSQDNEITLDYFTFLNLIDNKMIVNDFIKTLLKDE